MSHDALSERVPRETARSSELRRFAVVLAAKPAPIRGVRVSGLESVAGADAAAARRELRRFAIRPR